jgi:hypothetical protein
MPWPRGATGTTLWTDTEAVPAAAMNAIGAAFEQWQDNVNANEKNLSALGNLTFAADKGITQDAWTNLTLQNSWVNVAAGNHIAQVRKDKQGVVWVRGAVKDGNNSSGTVLFTLPAGYWPSAVLGFPISATAYSGAQVPAVYIFPDGTAQIYNVASNALIHFAFSFFTD